MNEDALSSLTSHSTHSEGDVANDNDDDDVINDRSSENSLQNGSSRLTSSDRTSRDSMSRSKRQVDAVAVTSSDYSVTLPFSTCGENRNASATRSKQPEVNSRSSLLYAVPPTPSTIHHALSGATQSHLLQCQGRSDVFPSPISGDVTHDVMHRRLLQRRMPLSNSSGDVEKCRTCSWCSSYDQVSFDFSYCDAQH